MLLAAVASAIAAFFLLDLGRYANFDALQNGRAALDQWVADNPLGAPLQFFLIYVAVAALSLPGAAIMTLAAGAIFGLVKGFVLVSFASTIGATLAMLIARKVAGEWVQDKYAEQLSSINQGLAQDGGFYLFGLRMVPLFPFFVVNLVMGLTQMKAWPFYWISQLGMAAGTVVFVFAGTQLGEISSPGDVLSPGLIAAFVLLGLFPILAKKGMAYFKGAANAEV